MAKTQSSAFLNEKINALSLTIEQHQEFCIVHQKLDAICWEYEIIIVIPLVS